LASDQQSTPKFLPKTNDFGKLSGRSESETMAYFNNAARAAGAAAEQEARWYIDRTFSKAQNNRVLHDVLLSDTRADAWCQIDHLIIGRLGYFIVLETKSAVQGMSLHTESGAWSVWHNGKPKPMKSPIAQNMRHIEVLGDFLRAKQIMPKRLFVSISPKFENWILVQPGARLPKEFGGARLVQRDQVSQVFDEFLVKLPNSTLVKVMTTAELDSIVQRIEDESLENKRVRDLSSKSSDPKSEVTQSNEISRVAATPDVSMSDLRFAPPAERERHQCENRVPTPSVSPIRPNRAQGTLCASCGGEMTSKEVNYCRFNFAKMGRRYLCRKCQ
jgi:hypothetical protein